MTLKNTGGVFEKGDVITGSIPLIESQLYITAKCATRALHRVEQTQTSFSLLLTSCRRTLQLSFTLGINTALQRRWRNAPRYLVSHKSSL